MESIKDGLIDRFNKIKNIIQKDELYEAKDYVNKSFKKFKK